MDNDEKSVREFYDQVADVWASNDGAAMAECFVADGSLINPFGQRGDGRDAIATMYETYFGGLLRGTTTVLALDTLRPLPDGLALADGEQVILGPGGATVLNVHLAALLRREAGSWRFVDARPYTFAARP